MELELLQGIIAPPRTTLAFRIPRCTSRMRCDGRSIVGGNGRALRTALFHVRIRLGQAFCAVDDVDEGGVGILQELGFRTRCFLPVRTILYSRRMAVFMVLAKVTAVSLVFPTIDIVARATGLVGREAEEDGAVVGEIGSTYIIEYN